MAPLGGGGEDVCEELLSQDTGIRHMLSLASGDHILLRLEGALGYQPQV